MCKISSFLLHIVVVIIILLIVRSFSLMLFPVKSD